MAIAELNEKLSKLLKKFLPDCLSLILLHVPELYEVIIPMLWEIKLNELYSILFSKSYWKNLISLLI